MGEETLFPYIHKILYLLHTNIFILLGPDRSG